ncbi:PTS sugar transporter subunit IIA [Clostridium fungisolvens]|uniref:PTS EIIA type-4 domain-containing protein n=1 Tax=Clostridium fungisolvens TaxID=1604897 RepID=A0A6V8SI33_9CLOT|nr:PTS sugar transporter subunit IIA [Clostridium fungisolvens]GFP76441.1 hypothetical protein bsdtw1_02544 [Clostridium fungisolvens]
MLKIFLSSHGRMASGIKSSLDILLGNSKNVTIFDAYLDENKVQDKLDEFYEAVGQNDQVLLLSDLYGGSVNQAMCLYLNKPNTILITGVNLPLVIELALRDYPISESEIKEIIEQSRSMLCLVNNDSTISEEENDFF